MGWTVAEPRGSGRANILLYASDASSPFHSRAVALLEQSAAGPAIVYLPWPVVVAYRRIATHPALFESPLSPDEAESNIGALLARPHVRPLGELDGFWEAYRRATAGVVTPGNLVPDAHLAALLLQHGVTTLWTHDRDFRRFWTHDRDFRRFEGLRVRDPFAEPEGS